MSGEGSREHNADLMQQGGDMGAPTVFVHLGAGLPSHIHVALAQARLFTAGPVLLVAPEQAISMLAPEVGLAVETVSCESLGVSEPHEAFRRVSTLDREFRDGFWTHATERFFVLETLMRCRGLQDVVHLENDVMLYAEVARLLPVLRGHFPHIAATFDAPNRCVPGLMYIRGADAMGPLLETIDTLLREAVPQWNDMTMVAEFRRRHPDLIGRLPIVTPDYPDHLRSQIDPTARPLDEYSALAEEFGGVFDAAAIGQFLGGVDPRNSPEADTRGFINETAVFNPSRYRYTWHVDSQGRGLPFMSAGEREWRINNLHIHSKALEHFASSGPGPDTRPRKQLSPRCSVWTQQWRRVSALWR